MSKEYLEAYEKIDNTLCLNSSGFVKKKEDRIIINGNIEFNTDKDEHIDCKDINEMIDCLETIKQALQRLEAIDNANPSEALESIEEFIEDNEKSIEFSKENNFKTILSHIEIKKRKLITIKQVLIKEQEMEKTLKIVFEKKVNILLLELAENVDEYNERIVPNGKLTKEEFELLKRWLK